MDQIKYDECRVQTTGKCALEVIRTFKWSQIKNKTLRVWWNGFLIFFFSSNRLPNTTNDPVVRPYPLSLIVEMPSQKKKKIVLRYFCCDLWLTDLLIYLKLTIYPAPELRVFVGPKKKKRNSLIHLLCFSGVFGSIPYNEAVEILK